MSLIGDWLNVSICSRIDWGSEIGNFVSFTIAMCLDELSLGIGGFPPHLVLFDVFPPLEFFITVSCNMVVGSL